MIDAFGRTQLKTLMSRIGFEPDLVQRRLDFGIRHEQLPQQSGPVILDHRHGLRLVKRHVGFVIEALALIEGIRKAVGALNARPQIAIIMA